MILRINNNDFTLDSNEHYLRSRNLALPQDSHSLRGTARDLWMVSVFLNGMNQLILVTVNCCVPFEVRTKHLGLVINIIKTNFGFRVLSTMLVLLMSPPDELKTNQMQCSFVTLTVSETKGQNQRRILKESEGVKEGKEVERHKEK
jgi:hypothetical protein